MVLTSSLYFLLSQFEICLIPIYATIKYPKAFYSSAPFIFFLWTHNQLTMEASQRKLSVAVVLLLLVMAAETGPVQAGECLSKSTTFKGFCLDSDSCNDKCLQESNAYSGGKCRGIYFTCWCITPCAAIE